MTGPAGYAPPPKRAGRLTATTWLALGFVAWFAYLDWITHRSVPTSIIGGGIIALLIVFRRDIAAALHLTETMATLPKPVKPILAAFPGIAYFLIRGQGTSNAGGIVFAAMLLVILANAFLGGPLDRVLARFYQARNRVLPRPVRMVAAIALPVLISFAVIHGNLSDLPALFGGTTHHAALPADRGGKFFAGTLLSAAVAWLLLRDTARPARPPAVQATGSQYGPPQYGQPQYGPPQYGPPQYGPPQYGPPGGAS
jgi:hypothetical protein